MGCIYSRKDINDINPRMFRAYNVDDQGCELSPGKIEVSDTELILHQKGKEPIRWPWRCLRRYGFDAELFSFESGRRCPLGPGIYAFRCKRAERLFNLVQECIQRAGQEDTAHLSQSVISATARTNSRPTSVAETQDSNGFAHLPSNQRNPFGNGGLHLYVNGPAANDYVNTGVNSDMGALAYANGEVETSLIDFENAPRRDASEKINYAVLDLPKSTENLTEDPLTKGATANVSPLKYADIDVENLNRDREASLEGLPLSAADMEVFVDEETETGYTQANYVNVTPEVSAMQMQLASSKLNSLQSHPTPSSPPTNPQALREPQTSKINYIQLDLNHSSENVISSSVATPTSPTSHVSIPDSPTKRNAERESYATIDFHKTTALQNSGKGTVEEEEGSRKTRHSSTISELN